MARKGTTKFKSNIQEKRVAEEVKGRVQAGSGCLWSLPSDVRTDDLLIECKTTEKDFYTLNIKTWLKIEQEAVKDGLRTPVMSIDTSEHRLAVINYPLGISNHLYLQKAQVSTKITEPYLLISFHAHKKLLYCYPWEVFLESYRGDN